MAPMAFLLSPTSSTMAVLDAAILMLSQRHLAVRLTPLTSSFTSGRNASNVPPVMMRAWSLSIDLILIPDLAVSILMVFN